MSTPQFEIGYWQIRGLAAPLRMMAAYAGAAVDDKQYPVGNEWFGEAKPALQAKNAMINLPYVVDLSSGLVVTQSTACLTFLGRKFGLMGASEEELARVEQVLAQAFDLRNDTVEICYPFKGVTPENFYDALVKHMDNSFKKNATKFEGFIGDRPYTAGDAPTAGDFHLWEMLDQHCMMAASKELPSPLTEFPKLAAFYKRFRELPQLASYFDGPQYKLPCNNTMANFK